MKRILLAVAAAAVTSGLALSSAGASVSPPHIRPNTVNQVCDSKGAGNCIQASGAGATIHVFAPNGNPNQEFNLFVSSGSCNNGVSTTTCPFPNAPAGKPVVTIGGQSAANSGLCGGWTTFNFTGSLVNCNGGQGTVFVLDGFALESGFLGRQAGGKTYLCETGGAGDVAVFHQFVSGQCQWNNLPQ